jgi:hypothetical protein
MSFSPQERKALDQIVECGTDTEELCTTLARLFRVRCDEVALLRIRGGSLQFVFPFELKDAGTIPLSSSAVAARTAANRVCERFNDFMKVQHHSVFELVPLGSSGQSGFDPNRIQKLMSAPIIHKNATLLGVIQISRKGPSRGAAGPDFAESDLQDLREVAQRIAPYFERFTRIGWQ